MIDFILPDGLNRLLASGVWPSAAGPAMTEQESRRIVSPDRVGRFAAEETRICLHPPPFYTIAQLRGASGGAADFWERFGALDQIDPERALILGDFGFGSESPIILDYSRDPIRPPVLRLRWGTKSKSIGWLRLRWEITIKSTEWVQGARDFDEFAEMLGLTEGGLRD
jgi:hypothetical protein